MRLRVFLLMLLFIVRAAPAGATLSAGTAITNVATFSLSDGVNTITGSSNTLTVYVQNAPVMTITNPSVQNVTPADVVTDTFTLTNTGNGAGTFALTGNATFGGTASGSTLKGYVLNGASSGTCSTASLCTTYTTLNAAIGTTAAAGTITIGVQYQVSASATTGQTIQPSMTANIAYAAGTGTSASTSSNVSNTTYSDTLVVDARLDVKAAATTPGSGGANITWTITANNGGAQTAQGLASAKTVLGAANNGIAIFIPMPSYNSTALQLQSQPSAPTLSGASGGAAAAVYYNATACSSHPTSGWSTTYSATALCLAVYVSNTTASVLPSAPSQSSGAGSVTTAQITFSFATNQPSGSGSANSNSVTLVASSAIGGLSWVTAAVPILGQGLAVGASQDAATASLLNTIQTNVTASSGTTPPGGASNQIGSNAFASYSVLNGPYNNASATGSYPASPNSGAAAADNTKDFEALSVACTNNGGVGVNGSSCTVGTNIVLVNTLQNTGNSSDTINVKATAPTGWKVQLYNATGCTAYSGTGCTQGASITSQSTDGGNVNGNVTVASGATFTYEAVFNATGNSTTPFAAYDTTITAAGQSGSGTGTDTNDTHDDLYPGGVTQLTASVNVTSTNCPSGVSPSIPAGTACPGGVLGYSIAYQNVVPAAVSSHLGTEPTFAYAALNGGTAGLVITCDGSASGNAWATNTFGLNAAPTDTTANTTYVYTPNIAFASGTYPSVTAGPTKFVATVGGASGTFAMGASGTISFNVTVK